MDEKVKKILDDLNIQTNIERFREVLISIIKYNDYDEYEEWRKEIRRALNLRGDN